ncbi:hypothetical protein MKW94_006780 [Papaver nudicaule]|uniref:Major facilitator superfamily (MFS) profile domain-containing protein n=1 Tax=Papaver nudicaule TaxID=74823 RepID=A0AA41SCE7_PAPNU|nr:hypothetical protein [Papaver nudicaule]
MDGEKGEEEHETLRPRLFYLTLTASIGGLVFGYYIGFITARFGMLSDVRSILRETIQSGLIGAIFGAAIGGCFNDCFGRKRSILIADVSIIIGGQLHWFLLFLGDKYFTETIGNMFIAFGVGMISITSPLYISEFSSPKLRDIIVSINFIFSGVGKLAFFYLYMDSTRTSNYIIALAGLPTLVQFCLMFLFPESPAWLYKKDRKDEAIKALENLYTCCEVEKEFDAFKLSIRRETIDEDEISYSGSSMFSKIRFAWSSPSVRRQFIVGTGLQVVQQLVGLNALIYSSPSLNRITGVVPSDPKIDIPSMKELLAGTHGIASIFGSFFCTLCLANFGKRKLLSRSIYSMLGAVLVLSFMYIVSPNTTEVVSRSESTIYFSNNTCLSYITAPDAASWDCLTCLRASSGCGFCRGTHYNILGRFGGACLITESNGTSQACTQKNRFWSTKSCEYNIFKEPLGMTFTFFSLSYSASLEIIPWIMNSQMYPIEVRGVYGGIAAAANWTTFLIIVVLSFLLTEIGGPLFIFLLISLFLFIIVLWLIKLFLPET